MGITRGSWVHLKVDPTTARLKPGTTRARRPDYNQHHIIDPRTGSSPTTVASVTVIAPSAMLADALATAALVLGPERGLSLLEQLEVEGLIIDANLELRRTAGWPDVSAEAPAESGPVNRRRGEG